MKSTSSFKALAIAMALVSPSVAKAGGVPTFDGAALAELLAVLETNSRNLGVNTDQLANGIDQLEKLNEQVQTAQSQLREAERTYASLTGARDQIMNLFKGDLDLRKISRTMGDLSRTGNMTSARARARLVELNEKYEVMTGREFLGEDAETWQTQQHDELTTQALAGMVVSEEKFIEGGEAIDRLDAFRDEIGSSPDLKTSVDLNTRVQIENGALLASILQSMAVSSHAEAAELNARLRTREQARRIAGTPTIEE